MSTRLDKKLNKLSEKMAQLRQEMEAIEAQKANVMKKVVCVF